MTTAFSRDRRSAVASLAKKLLNIFVSPGDVFEELAASPTALLHWLAPFLLICLTGIVSLLVLPIPTEWNPTQTQTITLSDAGVSSPTVKPFPQAATAVLTVVASALAGTLWS